MTDLITGSDHRGYELKCAIEKHIVPIDKDITKDIVTYLDCGCYDSKTKVDYPDVVKSLALEMKSVFNRGILVCGSGFGVAIAANRYPHIRAVTVRTPKEAEMARLHNDINVLCLGADFTSTKDALKIVDKFLTTKFEGGRHKDRVSKLTSML